MEKIIAERNRLKRNTWNFFSAKTYKPLSDRSFLNIIFKKAQKTYDKYVSFHSNIENKNVITLNDLRVIDSKLSKMFLFITEINVHFKNLIREMGLEKDFKKLTDNLEEESVSVWKEWFDRKGYVAA